MANAIIVGAGLVGPLLAMYLKTMGWSVTVFERNNDIRDEQPVPGRSINLTLCHRGFRALSEVGLEELVRSHCVPAYGRLIHGVDGVTTRQNYGTSGEAIYAIARNDLNRLLLDRGELDFGVAFHFHKKCVAVDPTVPAITLQDTRSGTVSEMRADVVFAIDGAHSAVRRQLRENGLLAEREDCWEQGYKEINIPVREESSEGWLSEKNVVHLWPRATYMLIGFPNLRGDFTLALHLPFVGQTSFESIKTEQDLTRLFEHSFPDVLEWVPSIAGGFFSRPINKMVTVRCSPWSFGGKVLLVGDSAHAIYPSYGQGANAGFEDCRLLKLALESGADRCEAFCAFETDRRRNTDAIADLCVDHFVEIRDRVGDAAFQRRKELERRVSSMYPKVYAPLYWNISFTDMPYADALWLNRRQERMLEAIVENSEGGPVSEDLIRRIVGRQAKGEPA